MAVDTTYFKKKLETEKAELEGDLGKVGRQDPNRPGEWEVKPTNESDPEFRDDVADQLEEMDEREEIESNLEERYEEINRALERIEAGRFGICEVGGEEIEADRLEANPAARTCKAHRETQR
jgi:RNA polymerase-binding transcription factor DksA